MRPESIVRQIDDSLVIEVVNETGYSFGSRDNTRHYRREQVLGDRHLLSSRHGVLVKRNGETLASAIFGAIGGASGVHERSLVLQPDLCFLAIGPFIACLELPSLVTRWVREVDHATCFGIHITSDRRSLISHGELEIARLTLAGDLLWQAGGRDIFTGDLSVDTAAVRAEDFNGDSYIFDLESGRVVASSA